MTINVYVLWPAKKEVVMKSVEVQMRDEWMGTLKSKRPCFYILLDGALGGRSIGVLASVAIITFEIACTDGGSSIRIPCYGRGAFDQGA